MRWTIFISVITFYVAAAFIASCQRDAFAGDEFSEKYRAYQNDMSTGRAELEKKDYEAAIKYFSSAISASPFEASNYYDRGVAYYKSGKDKEAIGEFDKVIILDNRRIGAYVYRGLCKERSGQYADALKDYSTAVSMNPKDANVHNNLAWLYATAKDEKVKDNLKALEHAVKASSLSDEKNAEILDTLAMVYFVNGKIKDAVETEHKALKLEPENERFKGNLKKYEEVK